MITITCPRCHQQHALFWHVQTEKKRVLSYRCDKVESPGIVNRMGDLDTMRYGTRLEKFTGAIDLYDLSGLPEEWSSGYRRAVQNKDQGQLVLMYQRPEEPK